MNSRGNAALMRWLGRWVVRGRPITVLAKLTLVAIAGMWRWHRASRRTRRESRQREITADYVVLPRERLAGTDGTSHRTDG